MKTSETLLKKCPKSGKIRGLNFNSKWVQWFFPITGLAALIWFLIRVIPKPSRMAYPCQQFAGSLFTTVFAVFCSCFGGVAVVRRMVGQIKRQGWVLGGVCALATALLCVGVLLGNGSSKADPSATPKAQAPSPVAASPSDAYADKAVARVYDPAISSFEFGKSPYDYYWRTFDVNVLQSMLERGIMEITGEKTVDEAWKKILPGVSPKSKIAVKVNNNNIHYLPSDWFRSNMTDPPMVIALTRSLATVGVTQPNLTFFDASRIYPDTMKADIRKVCPDLFFGERGTPTSGVKLNLSDFEYTVDFPQVVLNADYVIDCCLFKSHTGRITGAMKNMAGLFYRPGLFLHKKEKTFESSRVIPEIILHEALKSRLKLSICEAVFGCQLPTEYLSESQLKNADFFPDKKCSSLFVSRNPYLMDTVLLSFMNVEKTGNPNDSTGGTVDWLRNAASMYPYWPAAAINSGKIVPGAPSMPPKDLAFDPALIHFISVPNQGATSGKALSTVSK